MLKITEDAYTVETILLPADGGKFIKVTPKRDLTTFEALRLAKALEMASDHLTTT